MSTHKFLIAVRRRLHLSLPLQLGLLMALWLTGELLSRFGRLPIPGSIAGMFLALILFASGRVSPACLRRGANWLIGEMLLFFVPMALAVMDHKEFLGWAGLKIGLVIVAGTFVVMSVTALATDLCFRWMSNTALDRDDSEVNRDAVHC